MKDPKFYNGTEHGVNFAYYASDDEFVEEDIYAECAYTAWVEAEAGEEDVILEGPARKAWRAEWED